MIDPKIKLEAIKQGLIATIKKFHENPGNFFYEEDLRAMMFVRLFDEFENQRITIPIQKDRFFMNNKANNINPVKAEYHKGNGDGIRDIDIAVLNMNEGSNSYQRQTDFVIELKYENDKKKSKSYDFLSDVEKLKNNKGHFITGFAICFDLFNESIDLNKYKDENLNFNEKSFKNDENKFELIKFEKNKIYALYVLGNTDSNKYLYIAEIDQD